MMVRKSIRSAVRILGSAMIRAEPWTEARRAPTVVTESTAQGEPAARSSSKKAAAASSWAASAACPVDLKARPPTPGSSRGDLSCGIGDERQDLAPGVSARIGPVGGGAVEEGVGSALVDDHPVGQSAIGQPTVH